jgi:hypothetical protein
VSAVIWRKNYKENKENKKNFKEKKEKRKGKDQGEIGVNCYMWYIQKGGE